uniref:Nonstructural protein NS4 n=1 Tax=Mudumu virus TaxID=2841875 RepID=A0A8E8V1D0_9REOV|nr:nonstructural protein NS4 [Mudumu virus]
MAQDQADEHQRLNNYLEMIGGIPAPEIPEQKIKMEGLRFPQITIYKHTLKLKVRERQRLEVEIERDRMNLVRVRARQVWEMMERKDDVLQRGPNLVVEVAQSMLLSKMLRKIKLLKEIRETSNKIHQLRREMRLAYSKKGKTLPTENTCSVLESDMDSD